MGLIKKILRLIFSFKMLLLILFAVLLNNQIDISRRLDIVDAQLNPIHVNSCKLEELKDKISDKVVRIIGSYSEGSGFPISESEIITNFHVIDGEDSPKVVFPDGSIETPIYTRGNADEDVAILKLKRTLNPLLSIDPANSTFGQDVFAAGYPLGSRITGDITVVKGTYSGIRPNKHTLIDYVESSIDVEHGMSGGPLVDTCGQVLGVTTAGINGTSYFLNMADIHKTTHLVTASEIEKVTLDTQTPQGIVEAYYFYIRSRNLVKAYNLLGDERKSRTNYDDFKAGYEKTLQVNLVNSKMDDTLSDKVIIKLRSADWVDGELVTKYFEGYWTVKNSKLMDSNIKEVEDPGWDWFYEQN